MQISKKDVKILPISKKGAVLRVDVYDRIRALKSRRLSKFKRIHK